MDERVIEERRCDHPLRRRLRALEIVLPKRFNAPAVYEDEVSAAFKFENTIVNLLELPSARDLIDPGAVADPEAGSRFQLTIWVDDADRVCAELATRGVELLNGPMNRGWGMRTASFTDPDGHIWEIAQKLDWDGPSAGGELPDILH